MPRAALSLAECFQVLGVPPGAPWEQIRQAYLDLVRVWHPDRFQSNPELRERAERQLQKINEAYSALKNANMGRGGPEPPYHHPEPHEPYTSTASVAWSLRRTLYPFLRGLRLYRPLLALVLGVLCLIPAAVVWRALSFLRLAELDSSLIQSRLHKPAILAPSRIVNPLADLSINSDVLAAWARGEVVDLWRSLPTIGEKPLESIGPARGTDTRTQPANLTQQEVRSHPRAGAVVLPMPENGTEVLWTRHSGVGELWLTNETNFDAFATLVQTRRTEPQRAIYIQAKSKVCMRNIGLGTYDLVTGIGQNWDPKTLRFRAAQHSLERAGPLDFFGVTSVEGITGCRYDVVLRTR